MQRETQGIPRLTHLLVARGLILTVFGVLAVAWPEPLMIPALILVALTATILGVYELWLGIALRGHTAHWLLVVVHGAASVIFGLLTGGVTGLDWPLSMAVVTEWLLGYAWLCFTAAAVSASRQVFKALIACGIAHVLLAVAVLVAQSPSRLQLLFFGAAYAAMFGAWQLGAALLVSKNSHTRHAAAPSS